MTGRPALCYNGIESESQTMEGVLTCRDGSAFKT